MDVVFGLPKDCDGNTGIVVFVDRLIKMAHLAAVPDSIDGKGTAIIASVAAERAEGLTRWHFSRIRTYVLTHLYILNHQ